jgi:serine/threonine-protein kinase
VEGIVALIMVFGPLFYLIKRRYDLREKQLRDADHPKLLTGLVADKQRLEERVRNLESIVTSVDHELNLRLARLTAEQSRIAQALPATTPPLGDLQAAELSREAAHRLVPPMAAAGAANDRTTGSPSLAPAPAAPAAPAARSSLALAATMHAARALGELELGATLADRYHIERLLGRGGMGAVYLARDSVLGELVALKVVSSAWTADPREAADRFRREASAARRVSSPNVIRIHDLGQTRDGLLYISMEYFAGKTLSEVLAARGPLPLDTARDTLGQICSGLDAAHQVGVIHRDLKPANILVGERQSIKIIDFGLATATFFQGLTTTGLSLGTPEYMSPEQVRGRGVDARSDVYSLGAVAYHVVTGRAPFVGDSPIAIGFAHCSEPPRPPRELRADLPAPLEAIILAALAKDPAARPALAQLRAAL